MTGEGIGRLHGRVAIVTGGAGGIGLAIAERFVAEGAGVHIVDIDGAAAADAARRLSASWTQADLSTTKPLIGIVDEAVTRFGRLDILVNNAGISEPAGLADLTEQAFDRAMAVNVKAALFLSQAAARHMIPQRRGVIINLSSINAVLAMPGRIAYAVSKGAMRQLTNVLALELAPHGVRVMAIGPGTVLTDLARRYMDSPEVRDQILARTPLGRAADAAEIAAVAAFLASDDASYLTGQTVYADGGRLGLNLTMPTAD